MKKLLLIIFFTYPLGLHAQIITTIAGNGTCGHTGDGGSATAASVSYTAGGIFDKFGNFYFADGSETVRKVSPSGIITTVAGNGTAGFSGDGGPAIAAQLHQATFVAMDSIGNLYIADAGNYRIRKVDTAGIITTFAGNGVLAFSGDGGPATAASLWGMDGVNVDDSGNVYDVEGARIREINKAGIINTVVGNGQGVFSGDGGPAIDAGISAVTAFIDAQNNIYIADGGNYRVRKVTAKTGIISTIAGSGANGFYGDGGPALDAAIKPYAVMIDNYGNLFIADDNQRIRQVNTDGIITTLAGTGIIGFSGDGGHADSAEIHDPEGLAFDSCGNIYFADDNNCRIRKITFPYCGYLGVNNVANKLSISIFPNPASDIINVDNMQVKGSYQMLNIIGSIVQQGILRAGNNSISIQSLSPGIYMLELTGSDGQRTVSKIVKQ